MYDENDEIDDDEEIYGRIWVSQSDLSIDNKEINNIPKPPLRNESLTKLTNLSESEELISVLNIDISKSCQGYEGESVENLDIDFPTFEIIDNNNHESKINFLPSSENADKISISSAFLNPIIKNQSKSDNLIKIPKKPCFSEFIDLKTSSLEYYGEISEIVSTNKLRMTTNRKDRYGILLKDRLILFKKPEHKVSKLQIPIDRIRNYYWYTNTNSNTKKDCNKFKIDTAVKSYKFQCLSHESAALWLNHLGKLLIERGHGDGAAVNEEPPKYVLKAAVSIENVKGKRIFIVEPNHNLAYYENEDDFAHDIAMHRIQLRSSGVRRDSNQSQSQPSLEVITSYRKYRLFFDNNDVCNQWFTTLSAVIHKAISETCVAPSVKCGDVVMTEIFSNDSNRYCADCNRENPEWASVNLFVTLCSDCSGIHRGLGRHISTIQGILTDELKWQDINILKLFCELGNKNVNDFFLKVNVFTGDVDRRFVYEKYVKKSFIGKKDSIYCNYKDQDLLNAEFFRVVKTDDVMRTMRLFHIGADINYIDESSGLTVFKAAEEFGQYLQLTFLNNQSRNVIKDWRSKLFDRNDASQILDVPFQERTLLCSINGERQELRKILVWNYFLQIVSVNDAKSVEICRVFFENICLIREKVVEVTDQPSLVIVVRETELWSKMTDVIQTINIIEMSNPNVDHSNDIKDFKNVIGLKICPSFQPKTSFECMGWVLLSTPTDEWKPYLSVLNSNRYLDFHDPIDFNYNLPPLKLDLRKVQKIEEMRDKSYGSSCSYIMYNLASICFVSSVVYHIRSDTKCAHEEHLEAFKASWSKHDFSLSNQFLTKDNVPLAVHKMVQYLQLHGSYTEGLFRRVGSVKESEKIYYELIKDPSSFMLKDCTVYDVASALKLFFRKLDDPLLTKKLFKHWIAAVEIKDVEEQLNYYKTIIGLLPPVNYKTLRLLIFLLVEIVRNTQTTQMTSSTLSTSFNTCLLISGSQNQCFSHNNLQILPILIENYQYLFDVSEEEIKMEEIIRKGLDQICNEKTTLESTLLRQIFIDVKLENFLKSIVNFEKECITSRNNVKTYYFVKQLNIEQSMNSMSLMTKIFTDSVNITERIVLCEDRIIDDFHMHRIIYPNENIFSSISYVETIEPKTTRNWIFKSDVQNQSIIHKEQRRNCFQCWAYLSQTTKNKIFIELNETNQFNFWKNDQTMELLGNFTIKNILLYRSCKSNKKLIAFKDYSKSISNNTLTLNFPKFIQNFTSKSKSFTFLNFVEQNDYDTFLVYYDQSKMKEIEYLPKKGLPST